MQFGIALATAADSWKVVQPAEELGFHRAWFYGTQMLCADCFVAMGAASSSHYDVRRRSSPCVMAGERPP